MEKREKGFFERYFELSKNNTSVRTEFIAGLTTFITIAYILIINPQIIADPFVIMNNPEYAKQISNGVFVATCLGAFIGTALVAFYAKLPFAQAPGMGLNAFFAYTVVLGMGYTYSQALVVVFLSGILFIVITAIGLREAIIRAIPDCIKSAISPGIGLFIAIIGFKNAGFVVANQATLVSMVDFSKWQDAAFDTHLIFAALVALIGLILIAVLSARRVKGAILIGMLGATLIGIPLGVTHLSNFSLNIGQQFTDFMDVSFLKLDFAGLFKGDNLFASLGTIFMLVISFSLVNMFDSLGTLIGAARQAKMLDENGEVIRMRQALMSDAVSTAAGALVGTSTVTTLVESSAGIAEGGRTGLTALTTAGLFLIALLFGPVVAIIPSAATAPALIYVGVLMLGNIKDVDFSDITDAVPAFLTIALMPFTYSIANGIAFGLISFCAIKLLSGRIKEVRFLTFATALVFALRYAFISLG